MYRKILPRLAEWKLNPDRKPLILRGARQVGKTHILREFGRNNFKKVHYFDFERDRLLKSVFENSPGNQLKSFLILEYCETVS